MASTFPVVSFSALMVWVVPPPEQVAAASARILGRAAVALMPDPGAGPALERNGRRKAARARASLTPGASGSITVRATPSPDRTLLMEVYPARDANLATARRAIVIIHGPDWPAVDSGTGAHASAWLAQQGFHVFDIQSQQGADGTTGEATATVQSAIGWIKQHARSHLGHFGVNVDGHRIALLGRHSAGPLALASAASDGDAAVDAAISFYGPADAADGRGHPGAPALLIIRAGSARSKAGPQGVFLRDLEIPLARPGFDLVFGARGESRAEDAVVRFLNDVDERSRG
jgi:hypothetical protein